MQFLGLFLAGWFLVSLLNGSLGKMFYGIIMSLCVTCGVNCLGLFHRTPARSQNAQQLRRDLYKLKACSRKLADPDLCRRVGADATLIRKTIRQASVLVSMLESYRGQPDRHIEQLFGGHAPSLSQCAAVISELKYIKKQLYIWLDDDARRDIMIATGKLLTPAQIDNEIRKRFSAIAAMQEGNQRKTSIDATAGTVLGILTLMFVEVGIVCAVVYAAGRILTLVLSGDSCLSYPPLEPDADARSAYATKSAQKLEDISRLLLGHCKSARSGYTKGRRLAD
jgi:hypothetical protein